jgi:hypothetical protein
LLGVMTFAIDSQGTTPQNKQDSLTSLKPVNSGKDTATNVAIKPIMRSDTVIIIKHQFNHKEQIITGSVVMSCVILVLALMNNYNPR